MRQPPLVFQPEVAFFQQLGHCVTGKKLGRGAPGRGLSRHRLRPVFTKLESRGVLAIWPGTAGAIKAIGLIRRKQGFCAFDFDAVVLQRVRHLAQRCPTTGRAGVGFNFGKVGIRDFWLQTPKSNKNPCF